MRDSRKGLLLVLVALGLLVRLALAPYSSGSDIPQFYGFTELLWEHGLGFYRYAGPGGELWPYPWPYNYPPLWLLVLAACRLASGDDHVRVFWEGDVYRVVVDEAWVLAVKAPLILGDAIVAGLLYRLAGGGRRGLLAAALWLFNPMTIYISSVYGMFDGLAVAPLLASMTLLGEDRPLLAGVLLGVSAMFKQSMAPPALAIASYALGRRGRGGLLRLLAGGALVCTLTLAPFAVVGGLGPLLAALLEAGSKCSLDAIVVQYSFNGFSSLIALTARSGGADYSWALCYWWAPFTLLLAATCYEAYRGRLSLVEAAALGYTVYTATYWNLHHQHLVPLIALLSLLVVVEEGLPVVVLGLACMSLSGLWTIMFPVSWWFKVHVERVSLGLVSLLDSLSLKVAADESYTAYGLALTTAQLALIIAVLLEGRTRGGASRGVSRL